MRNPFRTERDAFVTVAGASAVAVAVSLAAIFGGAWAALGVFVALLVGLMVAAYVLGEAAPPEPVLADGQLPISRERDDWHRIVVLANETLVGEALHAEIQHRIGARRARLLVVAPVLNSRLRHWASDTDPAVRDAQKRLDQSLAALRDSQTDASGQIGADDPLQALEDALRMFPADEVIISTHPPQRSYWLERDLVPEARARFAVPITHAVVDLAHERAHVVGRGKLLASR